MIVQEQHYFLRCAHFFPITSFIQLSSLVKQDFQYFGALYMKDL